MSGRTFSLARNSPLRTTLIDEATGHAVYEVDTLTTSWVTKIRKLDHTARPPPYSEDGDFDPGEDLIDKKRTPVDAEEDESVMELPGTSDEMASIHWKAFSQERIVFRGKITTQGEFIPECGKMKGSYKFTGPDGAEYRWAMGAMGMNCPRLVTVDEKKTVIAKFHRAHYFTKKQKARLQVQPAGMDMLDYIILTFVFVENKRREREREAAGTG